MTSAQLYSVIFILIIVNLLTFIVFCIDKRHARKHLSRVPEKTLLSLSFLGGAIGALGAMLLFRHKTKHTSFMVLVPFFLLFQLIIITFIFINCK